MTFINRREIDCVTGERAALWGDQRENCFMTVQIRTIESPLVPIAFGYVW